MRYRVWFQTHPENSWKPVKDLFESKDSAEFYIQAMNVSAMTFFPGFATDIEEADCRQCGTELDEGDCCPECFKKRAPEAWADSREER